MDNNHNLETAESADQEWGLGPIEFGARIAIHPDGRMEIGWSEHLPLPMSVGCLELIKGAMLSKITQRDEQS